MFSANYLFDVIHFILSRISLGVCVTWLQINCMSSVKL